MLRIFDTVLITRRGDLDLLEARFREFEDLPVVHVICEATADLDGSPKPLHFAESSLWQGWHGKWNHVRVEAHEIPANAPPRERKNALREYLAHGVAAEPDEIVMHGNVDEIPAGWAVREIAEEAGTIALPVAFEMRHCAYDAGLVHPAPWRGTVAQTWRMTGSFAGMREKRTTLPAVVGAGTRLSMWGQDGDRSRHPDGHALWQVTPDETWPRWVRQGRPCR